MLSRLIVLVLLAAFIAVPQVSAAPASGAPDLPHMTLESIFGALDNPEIPEAWTGIWDTHIEMHFCESPTIIFSDDYTDTLCTGQVFDTGDQEIPIVCSGTATDSNIEMTCSGSSEVMAGCTLSMQIDYDGTRTGDTFSTTMVVNATYTGDCFGVSDTCTEVTITGERVGPAPSSCATPVDRVTWGTIKSRYE